MRNSRVNVETILSNLFQCTAQNIVDEVESAARKIGLDGSALNYSKELVVLTPTQQKNLLAIEAEIPPRLVAFNRTLVQSLARNVVLSSGGQI